jgi:ABC-type multidrug transport system fused ATPase/permease subunit
VEAAENEEDVHQEWPSNPILEIGNLSAKYQEDLPLVLRNVSLRVGEKERIGIVGRTGAGKSSIIQALFRIFEPENGAKYAIGQCNALEMGLHSLRQHLSVIPQTPFIFKGTVRQNIDPFGTATDAMLWKVLEDSGLSEQVRSLP